MALPASREDRKTSRSVLGSMPWLMRSYIFRFFPCAIDKSTCCSTRYCSLSRLTL